MNISIRKAAVALALSGMMLAPAAQAALVDTWNYDVETGFDDNYTSDGEGGGTGIVEENFNGDFDPNGDQASGTPTKLSWGEAPAGVPASDRSSIEVVGDVTGVVETNGPFVPGSIFTHNNFPIPVNSTSLSTASILSQLTLTPTGGPPSEQLPVLSFNIDFQETDNDGSCPGNSATICDDIFVLTNPDVLAQDFTYDSILYTVLLEIDGLTDLLADACTAVGVDPGCQGFLTPEGDSSDAQVRFRLVAAVPEPGTLSILALGLLCLALAGFSRNRRTG